MTKQETLIIPALHCSSCGKRLTLPSSGRFTLRVKQSKEVQEDEEDFTGLLKQAIHQKVDPVAQPPFSQKSLIRRMSPMAQAASY